MKCKNPLETAGFLFIPNPARKNYVSTRSSLQAKQSKPLMI
jgi:hypothetical protein